MDIVFRRMISHQDTVTALRPFYFVVHPDLFGKYPDQQVSCGLIN